VPILAPLVGLFALAEIFRLATLNQETVVPEGLKIEGNRIDGLREVFKHKWLWLRCSVIGLIVGAIPGAGGASSSFIAYGHAVQSAKDKADFGEGRIEGVIASESANDAKDGGQLFPTLGLGIPGSGSMAVFLAALLSQGILPGPRLLVEETHLIIVIALSLLLSNILTSIVGLTFTDTFTKILEVPVNRLLPAITVLALASALVVRNNTFDVWLTLVFAVLGVILIYLDISRIPFIIAFILGTILEQNYYLAIAYAGGDIYEALFTGQLNLILITIFVLTVASILLPLSHIAEYVMEKIRSISE
jgi:putative tricarboxylic transport membrane protein